MASDWEANLRTLIKNTEKDADFLGRGSSWKVRGVRGKTQVTMRLQEGLGENNRKGGLSYQGLTTKDIADEFCPQMERLVEEAKSGTITYFQYPPSNVGRGGGGYGDTTVNNNSYSYSAPPANNSFRHSGPTTSNIPGIAGQFTRPYGGSSNPYGGY